MVSCASRRTANQHNSTFIEYINDNTIAMKLDGVVIKDRPFKMQIPKGLQEKHTIIEICFLQVLQYDKDEKIITLYFPNGKPSNNIKSVDLPYTDFIAMCNKEDIIWQLKDIHLDKHKHFGIYKPDQSKFYCLYLNVKKEDVNAFNYSITSIKY